MAYQLKPLPYAENALEPHMSARTVQFHHGKHQKTYVDKLNELVANTPLDKKTLYDLVRDLNGQRGARPKKIFNNAGQVWNHEFFWESMTPKGGGGQPNGELAHLIETSFGGFDAFKDLFKQTAMDQFGSGWVWLTAEGDRLQVVSSANAQSPLAEGKVTLIGCDVWEHAYYLDHQNRRDTFVTTFLDHLISWDAAMARLRGNETEEIPHALRA